MLDYLFLAGRAAMAKFLATLDRYPPCQHPATLSIEQAMEKLQQQHGG